MSEYKERIISALPMLSIGPLVLLAVHIFGQTVTMYAVVAIGGLLLGVFGDAVIRDIRRRLS